MLIFNKLIPITRFPHKLYFPMFTHFLSLVPSYTFWKYQENPGFVMLSGDIEKTSGIKWLNLK